MKRNELNARIFEIKPLNVFKHPRISKFRAWYLAFFIKQILSMGWVVVFTGGPRTGKSYLLNKILPGAVFDPRPEFFENHHTDGFDQAAPTISQPCDSESIISNCAVLVSPTPNKVPLNLFGAAPGPVGIDELQLYDEATINEQTSILARRGVVLVTQNFSYDYFKTLNIFKAVGKVAVFNFGRL